MELVKKVITILTMLAAIAFMVVLGSHYNLMNKSIIAREVNNQQAQLVQALINDLSTMADPKVDSVLAKYLVPKEKK